LVKILPFFKSEISVAKQSSAPNTITMAAEFNEKKADKALGISAGHNASRDDMQEKGALDRDIGESNEGGLTKDGVRLHPQPTSDPLDPLNWSSFRKHLILAIVMWK